MGKVEYGLKSLADAQLLSELANIVERCNQITAEFLAYLAELDERQLFLDLGFASLFEYCVEELKLCESTAGRHIAAARVCWNYPEALALVARGALHASALSLLRKHLTTENAAELFELCTHRSARKIEELLAARFPRPDVRDLVRRLPGREVAALDVGSSAVTIASPCTETAGLPTDSPPQAPSSEPAKSSAHATSSQLTPASEAALNVTSSRPETVRPESAKTRRIEPLSADRFGVHFTADGEFCALLERVRGLAGHRLPSGDLLSLLKRGLEAFERELEKERFAVGRKARRHRNAGPWSRAPAPSNAPEGDRSTSDHATSDHATSNAPEGDRSTSDHATSALSKRGRPSKTDRSQKRRRHYSAAVLRAVFLRDGKQCSYVSQDGRRCGARRCLELDHVEPWSVGGEDTVENLRLRCRAHNLRHARRYFGARHVNAKIVADRRERAAKRDAAT